MTKTTKNLKEVIKKSDTEKAPRSYDKLIGILQVFVVVSIGVSTYVVYMGTQGYAFKALLIPQVLWAAILIVKKFVK